MDHDEEARVIAVAAELFGGDSLKAQIWFRSAPLREFEGKTAEAVVRDGRGQDVIRLLEMYEAGPAG